MPIEAKTENTWGGHLAPPRAMYPRTTQPVETAEDCEAVSMRGAWHWWRCSRRAKYAATGHVLSAFSSTVTDSPVETRFLCTQHSRKSYLSVIVRKERPA